MMNRKSIIVILLVTFMTFFSSIDAVPVAESNELSGVTVSRDYPQTFASAMARPGGYNSSRAFSETLNALGKRKNYWLYDYWNKIRALPVYTGGNYCRPNINLNVCTYASVLYPDAKQVEMHAYDHNCVRIGFWPNQHMPQFNFPFFSELKYVIVATQGDAQVPGLAYKGKFFGGMYSPDWPSCANTGFQDTYPGFAAACAVEFIC